MTPAQLKRLCKKYDVNYREVAEGTGYAHKTINLMACGINPITRRAAAVLKRYFDDCKNK